jgi:O-antigen/teichoic acid export membrane protein
LNKKALDFIKNFSYTLSSNLLSLVISTLVVFIIPKLIGVEEYGYWQLYIFYTSYIGFLHFGWNDGIYLRYGGKEYNDLNKKLFFSQYYMLFIAQLIIGIIISILAYLFVQENSRIFIIQMTSIALVIVNSRYMLLFILQATNRIKIYAQITMLDRILYIGLIILLLLFGIRNFRLLIFADLVGKGISLMVAMYACRDIVFRSISQFTLTLNEALLNLSVGIKLMLSNIAGKFIVGFVKFGIERSWDIATFGKVSLTLSVSNLVMLFINAVGIIMYPILRRTEENKLPNIYVTIRDVLMIILLGILIFYYPLKSILSDWLPEYAESLNYMAILFPIVIYEGKMSLLINTYLKTLRKERTILFVNVITVIVSAMLTILTTFLMRSLNLAIISIVILLALRSIISELILSNILQISVFKDIIIELAMTSIFIFSAWKIDSFITVILYGLFYLIYLFIKRSNIINSIQNLKNLTKA